MKFGASYMAIWLWIVPAVIGFYVWARRSRIKTLCKFSEEKLLPGIVGTVDERKRKIRKWMILLSIFLLLISLMRPQWGFQWQEVKRQGLDIVIALDASNSMLAEDVLPNRFERARLAIKDLVKKLHGDRVGLVVFSGRAFLQCPLTVDYSGFLLSLNDVDTDTIPVGGTSLAKAIYTSIDSYEGGKKKNKILIVITDGEDLEGGIARAIEKAKSEGVQIYCVGIGSEEGELIPVVDLKTKKIAFLKDDEGNVVKTRLVEAPLQRMALDTGGIYIHASGAEFGLDFIYDERLSKLEKEEFKSKMKKRYHERFQIPMVIVILLLLCEPLIGDRKREDKLRSSFK